MNKDQPSNISKWTAIIIGMVFACILWLLQPLNNYLLNNSFIADNYLPELVVAFMAILILIINPCLRLFRSKFILSMRQLALIFAILLVATAPLSLLRVWPHSLARANHEINQDRDLVDIHKKMQLPESLYLDPVGYDKETPASTQLYEEIEFESEIPWSAWLDPLLSWGTLIFFSWLLMMGLVLAIFPQWRDNERLPFPLLAVQKELIQTPEKGKFLPPIFSNRVFWFGFCLVVLVHSINGLHFHTEDAFPSVSRGWNLSSLFRDGLTRHLWWYVKKGEIIFTLVGIIYLVPNRVGFSMWFTVVAYQFYRMMGYEYYVPFYSDNMTDHRNGAIIGVAMIILWLGRAQWLAVMRSVFRRATDDVGRRNRTAGLMLLAGGTGMVAWHLWAGNSFIFACLSVIMAFITSLVLARIVAETGIPFLANYLGMGYFMAMMPAKWMSSATLYLTSMSDLIIREGSSRMSMVIPAMHGLSLDRDQTPRQHSRLAKGFMVVLLLGVIFGGMVHLWMGYNYQGSLDNKRVPIASWGSARVTSHVHTPLKAHAHGSWHEKPYSQASHLIIGIVVGVALQIACLIWPLWPLHPVGLLMANTWFLGVAWPSIFLGWAFRSLFTKYGGAQAYRFMRPAFLGLVLGEVFSAIFWALVPVILILLGENPMDVGHILIAPQ